MSPKKYLEIIIIYETRFLSTIVKTKVTKNENFGTENFFALMP